MNYLKLEDLTIEQKLGMVLCGRRLGYKDDLEFTLELIRNHALGAVQVPIGSRTKEFISAIKEAADYPILIINDMEKGYGGCDLPKTDALCLAACNNDEYYKSFGRGVAKFAKEDGFSGTWGPVIDIPRKGLNAPCSSTRHFGDTPEKVAHAAGIIASEFHKAGFFNTGKHYPGGVDSPYDSHMTETPSNVSAKELVEFDLKPYVLLMQQGLLSSVMTSHHSVNEIDPDYPATLSKKTLDILRNLGFDGVYFTDSLAMMGILQKYGEENVYGMCIKAGIDNILTNYRTSTKTCYEYIKKNFEDGMFTEEELNNSVRRVLELQKWVGERADIEPEFTEQDLENIKNISRDCVTAVTEDGLSASIGDTDKRRLFVVSTQMNVKTNAETGALEISDNEWYNPNTVTNKIKENFPNSEIVYLPEYSSPWENEKVLVAATKHDEVVFVTFCTSPCYAGTDNLTRRTEAVINALSLSGKISALVHFGNPLAVEPLNHMKRIIFGYAAPETQIHAFDVLAGKIEAKGKLPIDVDIK